ncbi:MAG: HIT domain-containing protein [Mollicutes bacterium]|nr:MAG: HIT domain-containing protein [Mollicutes bacterium]
MDNCIFCKIIRREIPSYILYENEYALVVLDAFPVDRGHTLIISKVCKKNLLELSLKQIYEITRIQQKIAGLLITKLGAKGFNFMNNFNRIAGQQVDHYHLHIIPKYNEKDGFKTCHTPPKTAIEIEKI